MCKYPVIGIAEVKADIGVFYMIYFHARIHRFLNDRRQLGVIKIQIMRRYGKSGNKRAGTAPLVGGLAESGRIRKASVIEYII